MYPDRIVYLVSRVSGEIWFILFPNMENICNLLRKDTKYWKKNRTVLEDKFV